jgi:hypothetical protein
VLVFILAVMWGLYLGMWLLARRDRRSMNSISTFNKHLAVLGRTTPGRLADDGSGIYLSTGVPAVPQAPPITYGPLQRGMTLADARNRRRQVLTTLAAVASVTAAMAFFGGLPMLVLHLVADLLLGAYLVLLVRTQGAGAERHSPVIYLPQATPLPLVMPEAAYLRRSAN